MAQIDLDSKNIGEWTIDLVITAASFVVGSKFFMSSGTPISDQPLAFLLAVGCGAVGFKLARQWKALG